MKSALAEPEVAEVIVVDDASTDDTVAAARAADDDSGRLKILTQPKNAGPSAARNRAMRESKSDWIGILDADDFFLPGRMKRLLAYSDKADFIADDAAQVAEDNIDGPRKNLLGASFEIPRPIGFAEFVLSNVTDAKRQRGELGFIKPIMYRNFLTGKAITYRENMRLGEDYELYARALAQGGRLMIVPEVGYISVVRPNSLSARHSESDLLQLRDNDEELRRLPGLSTEDQNALGKHYLSIDCRLQWRLLILAVKKKNPAAALRTFIRPYPVPVYLANRLVEQLVIRTLRAFGRRA